MEENKMMDTNFIEETEFVENDIVPVKKGNGLVKKGLIVGGLVAGAVVLYFKTKKRREKNMIEKLRKQGYVIYEPEDIVDETDVETTKED